MSIFSRIKGLLGRPTVEAAAPANMTSTEAVEIVQKYGQVLETSAPTPGCIADASKLPYPKNKIRKALLACLMATPSGNLREQMKVAYLLLADWQPGVGPVDVGIDLKRMSPNVDEVAFADAVVASTKDLEKWQSLAMNERATLKAELQQLGLW
jgi:hypothetical protein